MKRAGLNHRNQPSNFKIAVGLFIAILIVIWAAIAPFWTISWHQTEAVNTCTVIDKNKQNKRKGGSKFFVTTDRCGTFAMGNDIFIGHMDSRDKWERLVIGTTYEMKSIGWEYPLLSIKPNLIDYKIIGVAGSSK